MSFRRAALLCLTGVAAACSHNTPETQNPDDVATSSEPAMTPASLESTRSSETPTAATPTPSSSDVDSARTPSAPLVADTKGTNSNDYKADAPRSNAGTPAPGSAAAPDNTKVNERDKNSAALTPLDQQENETDLKITQNVRQAVMADGTLSFTAKNVKIITQGGKVTLRGPVKSAQERSAIEASARKVAGVAQVDNQLEVKK